MSIPSSSILWIVSSIALYLASNNCLYSFSVWLRASVVPLDEDSSRFNRFKCPNGHSLGIYGIPNPTSLLSLKPIPFNIPYAYLELKELNDKRGSRGTIAVTAPLARLSFTLVFSKLIFSSLNLVDGSSDK